MHCIVVAGAPCIIIIIIASMPCLVLSGEEGCHFLGVLVDDVLN